MLSLKSGLVAVAVTGLFGCLSVVGCSADGGAADLGTDVPATEPEEEGAQLPPPSSGTDTSTDAGTKKDSGTTTKKDSGTPDAGPPPPEAGDPCTTQDALVTRPCGACGTQQAICQSSGDGGALAWSQYGACQGELTGGCVPGTVANEACGNCGTVQKTCTKYCSWTSGSCTGQPTNSCKPGSVEYLTAGCTTPNTYKSRTCQTTCQWGTTSLACEVPVNANKMTISGTVGQTVTQQWSLTTASAAKKPSDCGVTSVSSSKYPQVAVEIRNTTAQKATVSIYHSKATGGSELDTLLWVYNKTLQPQDDASLVACDYGVEDSCETKPNPLCGNTTSYNFAGMSNITINAGSAILVYSSAFSTSTTGDFNLNVKTDALQ